MPVSWRTRRRGGIDDRQRGHHWSSNSTGEKFVAADGGPQFTFSEAISFQIPCADQDEVNYYWSKLSGGQEVACAG